MHFRQMEKVNEQMQLLFGCKQVAILCNHQRSVPKGHAGQMEKLGEKMHNLNEELLELQREVKALDQGKAYKDKKKRLPDV